ncbi:MAG: deoxyribonuclease IV [Parachlamydiales bacterium]|nr:deoxyribonuclease IV [Parachlamydiales bacterium]
MKPILIGAHMSAAGGVSNALYRGKEIGANTIQLFTANQKQWKGKKITPEEVERWDRAKKETGITIVTSHGGYLINLGSPNQEILHKSSVAFQEEIKRCHLLHIDYLNFHPGSATGSSEEQCLDTIIHSLLHVAPLMNQGSTTMVIECTAGQGSQVGYQLEHLAYIIQHTHKKIKIGVCLDTCHMFAAGYDIRSHQGWERVLKEFDALIGIDYLKALHLNDSSQDLGSRKDRHASLEKGKIGLECFRYIMNSSKTKYLPKYLETPSGDKYWKNEIKLLQSLAQK